MIRPGEWKYVIGAWIASFFFLYLSPWYIEFPVIFIGIPSAVIYKLRKSNEQRRNLSIGGSRQRMLE